MPSDHHHFHDHRHDAALVDMIDLDAIVSRSYLAEITSWVHGLSAGTPIRRIVDVGAGTGSAGIALAGLFPDADVVATDISEDMLRRVRERAEETGVRTRVSTAQMDMSKPWSIQASFDLAWAASCLHEVQDPDRAFRNLFDGLNPGGLLVVVEMDSAPRFLTDEVGDGLESRIRQALQSKRAGHPDHPDWTSNLAQTGFDLVERRQFIVDERPDGGASGAAMHRRTSNVSAPSSVRHSPMRTATCSMRSSQRAVRPASEAATTCISAAPGRRGPSDGPDLP